MFFYRRRLAEDELPAPRIFQLLAPAPAAAVAATAAVDVDHLSAACAKPAQQLDDDEGEEGGEDEGVEEGEE